MPSVKFYNVNGLAVDIISYQAHMRLALNQARFDNKVVNGSVCQMRCAKYPKAVQ